MNRAVVFIQGGKEHKRMSRSDKIGLGVLITLMVLFAVILVWTIKPPDGATRTFQDNVFVEQRMINLQKNR